MSSFPWTLLTMLAAAFAQAKCESTAYPVIPKHLLDCYRDDGIYHRANRMPASFDSFVDLVRKVEEGPASRNLDARELALVLMHYVKLDGIQLSRPRSKHFPNILPFSPSGGEYFKHRLTLVGLIPKVDPGYQAVVNETLTKREMCNLHFMLSHSIDPYKRDDERCSPLFREPRRWESAAPSAPWDSYRDTVGRPGRNRRRVGGAGLSDGYPGAGDGEAPLSEKSPATAGVGDLREALGKRFSSHEEGESDSEDSGRLSRRRKSVSRGEKGKKSEVEEIDVRRRPNAEGRLLGEEKDKFTVGDQELLGAEERRPSGMQSLVRTGSFGRYGGRPPARAAHEEAFGGLVPGIPLSDCPAVNGVVVTPFGSLTLGTVVAGIAAGLNPEDIPPRKFSVEPEELESPSDRLKNIWAVTLAGTVADTISSSALLDGDGFRILKGGWNDSSDPRWYLLDDGQFAHLPEVALRGSLDGLLLGLGAKEWTAKFPGFRLSQMLQTYYGCGWGKVGARHRVRLRPEYAPDELFRKQVLLMSLVMQKQKTNVLTLLEHKQVTREAVATVVQHVQTLDENEKSYIGSFSSSRIENFVNMIAVVDSSWGHENLKKIFEVLRTAGVVNVVGSNLTVVCGKDGRVLLSSANSADFYSRFTKDLLMQNCTRGLDFPLIFDVLDVAYRKIFHDEKTSQKMNGDAQIAVLFPYESLSEGRNSYLEERSLGFRRGFPDVRLVVASNGRSESFLGLVNDPKDLFSLAPQSSDPDSRLIREFAEKAKLSHHRISRPSCGSYFDDQSEGIETRATRDVGTGNVVYYRLSPQYFYTQHGRVTVTIRSKLRLPLTVCHSRKVERPGGREGNSATDRDPGGTFDHGADFPPEASPYGRQTEGEAEDRVRCKTIASEPYEIEMNDPCAGASGLRDCDPLYVSLSPPHRDAVTVACTTCRLPSDAQFEILAAGLTCYNAAAPKSLGPLLLSLPLLLVCRFLGRSH